jgi:hypothetical protein
MLTHWELEHYRQLYRNQIDRLVETLTVRLLPTFDSVHAEVEALQQEAYRASRECANDGNGLDPQTAHEAAFEASLAHFDIVLDLRQGLQNMFAVSLYHLFEQQVRAFHVRVLNHKPLKFGSDVLKAWDKTLPDPVLTKEQRSGLDELRLLANTVKHGDGASAQELYTAAPHLFWLITNRMHSTTRRSLSTSRTSGRRSSDKTYSCALTTFIATDNSLTAYGLPIWKPFTVLAAADVLRGL